MTGQHAASAPDTERVTDVRDRAHERLRRQRQTLRPLGLAVILVVAVSSANSHPAPGLHGQALGVTLALCVFAGALLFAIGDRFLAQPLRFQAVVIATIGAAGIALAGLEVRSATGVAAGAAVFLAVTRLPTRAGLTLGALIAAGVATVTGTVGASSAEVATGALVTVLLGVVGQFLRQARESQDRSELLLAQLQDARDEQARAAAIAERGRIASELHDLLAHSLSGAAIQLQGARKLAGREAVDPPLTEAIDRASELVKAGLTNARQAVGALRGDSLPTLAELPSLIKSYRDDMDVDVTLRIEGVPRTLPDDRSLALYRGAQEALTNVARYAPGAATTVVLRYEPDRTGLSIDNPTSPGPPRPGMGGGHGLQGMRQRVERVGGRVAAGPTSDGWRVRIEVPE